MRQQNETPTQTNVHSLTRSPIQQHTYQQKTYIKENDCNFNKQNESDEIGLKAHLCQNTTQNE